MQSSIYHPLLTASLFFLSLTCTFAGLLPYGPDPGPGDIEVEGLGGDDHEDIDLVGSFTFQGNRYTSLTVSTMATPLIILKCVFLYHVCVTKYMLPCEEL